MNDGRVDLGERCPNAWLCKERCVCHRLGKKALKKDLAQHYRLVVTGIERVPVTP